MFVRNVVIRLVLGKRLGVIVVFGNKIFSSLGIVGFVM